MILSAILRNAYAVMIPLSLIEGPMVAIGSGIGAALGYVDPFLAFAIILAGSMFQDFAYYGLGRWAASVEKVRRFATRTRLIRDSFLPIEQSWRKNMFLTLLISKLAYGLYAPFIVTAGLAAVPFVGFLAWSVAISAIFLGAWLALGYGLARFYGYLHATGALAPYVVGAAGVFGLVLAFFVMRHARRRLDPGRAAKSSHLIETEGNATSARRR